MALALAKSQWKKKMGEIGNRDRTSIASHTVYIAVKTSRDLLGYIYPSELVLTKLIYIGKVLYINQIRGRHQSTNSSIPSLQNLSTHRFS